MDWTAGDVSPWALRTLAFVFGAMWGSFFNVAIHRWPRDMSVVAPASHCPTCHARIPAHLNIPILGYILLRGRSACCGTPLSPRYPLVETLAALLCLALVERIAVAAPARPLVATLLEALCYFAFAGGLLVATFVDLEHMEIPDEVSLPGAALGLATATFRQQPGVEAAALGAGAGFLGVQLLFVWSYERLTGRRGMGEGDAKLLMMIGAFIGWRGVLFSLVAGAAQGLIAAGIMLARGTLGAATDHDRALATRNAGATGEPPDQTPDAERAPPPAETEADTATEPPARHIGHAKLPFGPFLALAALEFLFFGEQLIEAYFSLLS